jgi:arginyl-tRNA synthetase
MNIYAEFETRLTAAAQALERQGVLPAGTASGRVTFEPARRRGHGDLVTQAPLTLARAAGMRPRELAGLLAARLGDADGIEKIDVAGPGFINLTLTSSFWTGTLARILEAGPGYGRPSPDAGGSAAGPAGSGGPVSVGCVTGARCLAPGSIASIRVADLRPILTADALANLLEFTGRGASRELAVASPREAVETARAALSLFGVRHDIVFPGQSPQELPSPQAPPQENRGRSAAAFAGDERRAPALRREAQAGSALIKSNGGFSTFAFQLAYYHDRLIRGFKRMITVLGANHGAAVESEAAIRAAASADVNLQMKICQPMRLTSGGRPVDASEEAGSSPAMSALAARAGSDSLRFMILYCKNNAPLELDLDNVADQSWNNPVFYVQYAHARACSALRTLQNACPGLDIGEKLLSATDLHLLTDQAELSVIKRLSQFPRVIEFAAERYEPQRIALFLYELAGAFHELWKRSKESPQLRFNVHDNRKLTRARGALVSAVVWTIRTGLGLLGVKAVSEMR